MVHDALHLRLEPVQGLVRVLDEIRIWCFGELGESYRSQCKQGRGKWAVEVESGRVEIDRRRLHNADRWLDLLGRVQISVVKDIEFNKLTKLSSETLEVRVSADWEGI